MKRRLYFLIISLMINFVLIGCNADGKNDVIKEVLSEQNINITAENSTENNVDFVTSAADEKNISVSELEGIYYQPIPERKIGYVFTKNSEILFPFSYLYYNDNMYTSSYEMSSSEKNDIEDFAEWIKESELATVYSNRAQFWSEDGSKLSHVDDNINGTIYSITGYDEDFRVCVCYEQYIAPMDETYYGFIVFDRLNDIIVNKGSDLFKDRLHIDEYSDVCIVSKGKDGKVYEEKLLEDCSEFVQAMLDGRFIESDYDTREDFNKRENYTLVFYTRTGLNTTISVFPDGYVSMTSGGNTFIEEVNQEACQNIIKHIM